MFMAIYMQLKLVKYSWL